MCYTEFHLHIATNSSVDLSCNNGDIRLIGGTNALEGSVEICYNHFWGSVCDSSWDSTDANVVCRSLGHQTSGTRNSNINAINVIVSGSVSFTDAYFGRTLSPLIIRSVYCRNSESSLLQCSYASNNIPSYCNLKDVAGVACTGI